MEEGLSLDYITTIKYLDDVSKISKNCQYTCIDVTTSYLVVGTDAGTAYLYNRKNGRLQKLELKIPVQNITHISCLESVDLLVAVGTQSGVIIVFQQLPSSLHENEPMQRYEISGIHQHAVKCLKWNKNGVRLFSGDDNGIVAVTEMEYVKRQCKSIVLYRENFPIVQIDYYKSHLLISTQQRTILAVVDTPQYIQVGQKERKCYGNFGAHFFEYPSDNSISNQTSVSIFASRPALRLWKANIDGLVLETYVFKDNSTSSCKILHLGRKYNAMSVLNPKPELQFGPIKIYAGKYLLTWGYSRLMLLATDEPSMVAKCDDFENIRSVTGSGDEIFVLDGFRRITRIASTPDILTNQYLNHEALPHPSSLPFKMDKVLKTIEVAVAGTTLNLTSSLIKPFKPTTTTTTASNMNMSLSTSDIYSRDFKETESSSCLIKACNSVDPIWAPLSGMDINDNKDTDCIVYARNKTKKNKNEIKAFSTPENMEEVIETTDTSNEIGPVSTIDPMPNVSRSDKEILIAQMFQLSDFAPISQNLINSEPMRNEEAEDRTLKYYSQPSVYPQYHEEAPVDTTQETDSISIRQPSLEYPDIYSRRYIPGVDSLCYGPPSGSSNITSYPSEQGSTSIPIVLPIVLGGATTAATKADETEEKPAEKEELKRKPEEDDPSAEIDEKKEEESSFYSQAQGTSIESKIKFETKIDVRKMSSNDTWVQHKPPGQIQSLAVCDTYMVCTDTKDTVYYSLFEGLGLEWHKTEYPAKQISISPSGKRVWRIYNHSAYALAEPSVRGPFGTKWMEVALDVQQISVHESSVWHVSCDGQLYCQTGLKLDKVFTSLTKIECPSKIASVACSSNAVLALTMEGEILWRTEVDEENPQGKNWITIKLDSGDIFAATLGSSVAMWVVDGNFDIWFLSSMSLTKTTRCVYKWWQVKISDYIYQNTSALQRLTSTLMDSLSAEQLSQMLRMNTGNPCIACHSTRGIWFYNPSEHKLLTNQRDVIGHSWNVVEHGRIFSLKWKVFTASGVYHHHGGIWLWSKKEQDMFCFNPTTNIVSVVKPPQFTLSDKEEVKDGVRCLVAAPDAVWLLTKSGRVFIRKDITANNAVGSKWVELDITQISDHTLFHVCLGSNLVWAVDSKGTILMRIGSLQVPSIHNFPPAWVIVDEEVNSSSNQKPVFTKVYVGSLDYIVWAIDTKNNIYVREGIFPEILIGVGWVLVSGIQAEELAISEQAVYALTPTKQIYRRYNITRNNYIGDYWKELPGKATQLSVSVDDKLWCLNMDHELIQHNSCEVSGGLNRARNVSKNSSDSSIDDEWELV